MSASSSENTPVNTNANGNNAEKYPLVDGNGTKEKFHAPTNVEKELDYTDPNSPYHLFPHDTPTSGAIKHILRGPNYILET